MRLRSNTLLSHLLFGSFVPLVLFVAAAAVGCVTIARLFDALNRVAHSHAVISVIHGQLEHVAGMESALKLYVLSSDRKYFDDFARRREEFTAAAGRLSDLVADNTTQVDLLGEVGRRESAWAERVDRDLDALGAKTGNPSPEALRQAQARLPETLELAERLRGALDAFAAAEADLLRRRRETADRLARQSVWVIGLTLPGALVAAALLAVAASRSVLRPVRRLRESAGLLVNGRFCVVPPEGPTELAELAEHFNQMSL